MLYEAPFSNSCVKCNPLTLALIELGKSRGTDDRSITFHELKKPFACLMFGFGRGTKPLERIGWSGMCEWRADSRGLSAIMTSNDLHKGLNARMCSSPTGVGNTSGIAVGKPGPCIFSDACCSVGQLSRHMGTSAVRLNALDDEDLSCSWAEGVFGLKRTSGYRYSERLIRAVHT